MSASHRAEIFLQACNGAGPYCAEMHYGKLVTASRSKAPRHQTSSHQCAPNTEPAAVSSHFLIR